MGFEKVSFMVRTVTALACYANEPHRAVEARRCRVLCRRLDDLCIYLHAITCTRKELSLNMFRYLEHATPECAFVSL